MTTKSTLLFAGGVTLAVAIAVLAPKQDQPEASGLGSVDPGAALPEGHPPLAGPSAAPAAQGPFATVQETQNSGGYTYARVELEGEEIWVAGPVTELSEGDEIALGGAMGMENFHAASLDRTFESILFVNRFQGPPTGGPAIPDGAPASSATGGSGTAMEVLHAGGYTFVRVDRESGEVWVAGLATDISEGQTVAWEAGSVMTDFDSPSLDRTFDEILFVDGLRVTG